MPIVSEQVKILLERMDLYPQEFVRPYESRRLASKWNEILQGGTFNKVEEFLLRRKFYKLRRKATQDMILATIMYEPDDVREEDYVPLTTTSRFSERRMFSPKDVERIKSQWYTDDNNNRF